MPFAAFRYMFTTTYLARLSDAARLFAEVRGLLAADGILVVTTPNYRSLWPIIEWGVNRVSPVSYEQQHVNKYRRSRLISELLDAGTSVVSVTHDQEFSAVLGGAELRLGPAARGGARQEAGAA